MKLVIAFVMSSWEIYSLQPDWDLLSRVFQAPNMKQISHFTYKDLQEITQFSKR